MQALSSSVEMFSPERGTFIRRAFLIASAADLPARALLCNCVQFNGSFSCWSCKQKGETATRGKGYVHVFSYINYLPKGPVRTTESVLKDAQKVINTGKKTFTVNGIKGPPWLSFCPKYELANGMAIDYMQWLALGHTKIVIEITVFP